MPITYTNRKGLTYYLCQGVTKTGKPRFYFAREPRGESVEQIPEGFTISESVNGVVSLVKSRPSQILPEEVAAVETALKRHGKSRNYRFNVKPDRVEIYERTGADPQDVAAVFERGGLFLGNVADRIRETMDRHAHFIPILRFTLTDAERRTFRVERMCFLGSIDDWISIDFGPIDQLAQSLIPRLGTDAFFELH